MRTPPPELNEFLFRYDPAVQSLALGLRAVVLSEMAPCHEYIFSMRGKVVLLYGPTERVIKDAVCMIAVFRRHANLTFTKGADLPDKAGVLLGRVKGMRHIRLQSIGDLDRPEIRTYLRRARRLAGRTGSRRAAAEAVVTRVKAPNTSAVGLRLRP